MMRAVDEIDLRSIIKDMQNGSSKAASKQPAARELEVGSAERSVDADGSTSANRCNKPQLQASASSPAAACTAEGRAESPSLPRDCQSDSDIIRAESGVSHMPPTTGPARHGQPAAG